VAQPAEVISHWHQSIEGLSTSSQDFYASIEKALQVKEAPGLRLGRSVTSEGGVLSAQREYLSVGYQRFTFEICGAPFGKDFFFSWWLTKRSPSASAFWGLLILIGLPILTLMLFATVGFFKTLLFSLIALIAMILVLRHFLTQGSILVEDALLAMPIIGFLYQRFARPVTYYSEDTRLMFEDTVHRTVVQIVEGLLTLNKLPALTPEKTKPQSRSAVV
jgi:hypothetical protein